MPRHQLSDTLKAGLYAPNMSLFALEILKLEHTSWTSPVTLANNKEDISVNGVVYTGSGLEIRLPRDSAKAIGTMSVTINNVDHWLTSRLRSVFGELLGTYMLVRGTDVSASPKEFDAVERVYLPMSLGQCTISKTVVTMEFSHRRYLQQSFPWMRFNPKDFPLLFP